MIRSILMRAAAMVALGFSGLSGPLDLHPRPAVAQEPLRVVTTLPVYADLVRAVGGGQVEVSSIANPNEDAHFVRPKPSFALDLRRADAFVTTGLDLEVWVPTLLDRAGNADVIEGGPGYITAYTGITLLDIPASADRSGGDVHIFGNPHLTTDPLRTIQVARNVATGLKRVAPDRADVFDAGLADLTDRIHRHLFGARLVELLGGSTLERLALNHTLFEFLRTQEYEGRPLIQLLGGWLAAAEPFRGQQMICYHKNWAYFEDRFDVTCAEYVESKPGIAPTPGHVARLLQRMQADELNVLLAASYFDRDKVEAVARRGNAVLVQVPLSPGARDGIDDYLALVDVWVSELAAAFHSR
ncbi:MAG: metal ABC transporter substrate-binding protein [Gemmatimonadetes bacterium]|nr:metal ABC transporter substrate-binding protein [Gemmatimonadota bacterium]NNK62903.1 zinc ABC transporter substrate-binding protein [Gemmatimonadota bacterium]